MTITIKGIQYDAQAMTPREQFHVMRRLAPLLGAASGPVLSLLDGTRKQSEVFGEIASAIGPLTEALATMPDDLVDYVLDACLSHVVRMDSDAWRPIYIKQPRGAALRMYQDIDTMTELRLVSDVIEKNLSGFFELLSGGGASSLSAPAAP